MMSKLSFFRLVLLLILCFHLSSCGENNRGNARPDLNENLVDSDGDGIADATDNCPDVMNVEQYDNNHDGIGEACSGAIPKLIINKANEYVISKLGKDFFLKNIRLNYEFTKYVPVDDYCVATPTSCATYLLNPHYNIVYYLSIADKSFIHNLSISFAFNVDAQIIADVPVIGIPDCILQPSECTFPIDETRAREIATEAHFEQGLYSWEVHFYWYGGDINSYVWGIQNVLFQDGGGGSRGRAIIIDANSGEVILTSDWEAIP